MIKSVKKPESPLKGEIVIPSDKSISHRAVMFSSIAGGDCIIRNFSSGADCHSTLNLFKALGVDIQFLDDKTLKIHSAGKLIPTKTNNLYPCLLATKQITSFFFGCYFRHKIVVTICDFYHIISFILIYLKLLILIFIFPKNCIVFIHCY